MSLEHTGQVIVTDLVDHLKDIHPSYKWEVGRRLALWALAKDYNKKVVLLWSPTETRLFEEKAGDTDVPYGRKQADSWGT